VVDISLRHAVGRCPLACVGVALLANAPRHPPEKTRKKKDEVSMRLVGSDKNTCCMLVHNCQSDNYCNYCY